MINHLLAEEEKCEDNRTDSRDEQADSSTRLSSISRPSWSTPIALDGNYQNKRKALKLSNVRVSIPNTSTSKRQPGVSPFTSYIIHVETGRAHWNVRRRYSDFYYMHRLLKSYIDEKELPNLPPKKYIGSSTSSAFVEERRRLLERYLRELLLVPSCWLRSDVVQFLDSPQNILMFTWNHERMQKMQELLGSMTIENQNQTEILTKELHMARSEVLVLKERISQMEMLFLQQATGAAASKLDTSAVETLNNEINPRLSLLKEEDEEDDEEDGPEQQSDSKKTYAQIVLEKSDAARNKPSSSTDDEDSVLEEELSQRSRNVPEIELNDDKQPSIVNPDEVIKILQLAREDGAYSSEKSDNPFVLEEDIADAVELQQRMVMMSRKLQHAVKLSNELLEEKFNYSSKKSDKKNVLNLPEESADRESVPDDSFASMGACDISTEGIISELLTFDISDEQNAAATQNVGENSDEIAVTFGDVGPAYVSSKCTSGWSKRLAGRMDEILTVMIPTEESIADRMYISHFVKSMVSSSIGGQLFPIGSFCSKTFLPGGAIDLCSFLTAVQSDSWFVRVNEALCISSMGDANDSQFNVNVRNVSFINADIKVVKSIMNNVEVDISVNQITALYAQALIDKIDSFIGEKHLFKRSCILIKMWCKYESSRHTSSDVGSICGAKNGRLSNWAIIVMVMWVFNKYGRDIHTTFQALCGFLCYFSSFDWGRYAITVYGPVSAEDLGEAKDLHNYYALPKGGGFIPDELLSSMRSRFQKAFSAIYAVEKGIGLSKSSAPPPATSSSSDEVEETERDEPDQEEEKEEAEFTENNCDLDFVMGVQVHRYYRRGLINVMDPIQPKNNLTRSVDAVGARALVDALLGGKSSLAKLCYDSEREMADAQQKLEALVSNSSETDADTMALLAARDIPLMRTFFENSTRFIASVSRGKKLPAGVEEQEALGYPTLRSNQRELELAMKHAELILGNIITPEALARLIVHILEVKGALPVGEVGKLLQEATGNENLAPTLKTSFKGLKKVIEGFPKIFRIGTDHPFNPLVFLSENYIQMRDGSVLDGAAVAELYVFEPSVPSESRLEASDPNFVPLGKKNKPPSFSGDSNDGREGGPRDASRRSGSFGSSVSIESGSKKPPSARNSPSNRNRNKMDHGGVRLSAQEYQQYQQYQMHMLQEQQRYHHFMQQQQQQPGSGGGNHKPDSSVLGGDSAHNSLPPPITIPYGQPPYPPSQHIPAGYMGQMSPGGSPMAGGYYYDQASNAYFYPHAMGGPSPHVMSTSPTAGPGVALRRSGSGSEHNKSKSSPRNNSSQQKTTTNTDTQPEVNDK